MWNFVIHLKNICTRITVENIMDVHLSTILFLNLDRKISMFPTKTIIQKDINIWHHSNWTHTLHTMLLSVPSYIVSCFVPA